MQAGQHLLRLLLCRCVESRYEVQAMQIQYRHAGKWMQCSGSDGLNRGANVCRYASEG